MKKTGGFAGEIGCAFFMSEIKGCVLSVQPFSINDGPGTRATAFLKGCNLRCWWCHNPESQSLKPEIMFLGGNCLGCGACAEVCPNAVLGRSARFTPECANCGACAEACYAGAVKMAGEYQTPEQLTRELLRDIDIMSRSGGGVTFSGGEPFLQSEFLGESLRILKEAGVNTAVETALNVPWEIIEPLASLIDIFFADIKSLDPVKHRSATGADNARILYNFERLAASGAKLVARTPVIPGFNDSPEDIGAIAEFLAALPSRPEYELLAFHGMCSGKYEALGREFEGAGLTEPEGETMRALLKIIERLGLAARYRA